MVRAACHNRAPDCVQRVYRNSGTRVHIRLQCGTIHNIFQGLTESRLGDRCLQLRCVWDEFQGPDGLGRREVGHPRRIIRHSTLGEGDRHAVFCIRRGRYRRGTCENRGQLNTGLGRLNRLSGVTLDRGLRRAAGSSLSLRTLRQVDKRSRTELRCSNF